MYPTERIDDQVSKETSKELELSLSLVEEVIRFQFKTANEATYIGTSVELTGLGVFKVTKSKLTRKLGTLQRKLVYNQNIIDDETTTEKKRASTKKVYNTVVASIEFLQKKRDRYEV